MVREFSSLRFESSFFNLYEYFTELFLYKVKSQFLGKILGGQGSVSRSFSLAPSGVSGASSHLLTKVLTKLPLRAKKGLAAIPLTP
jgi:hypothetical protein